MITIVVPIYNKEKYLRQCIDSIIKQTYKNIEVILVNDGSKDSSYEICMEYSKKDTRVKVIDKMNGGVSSARNEGIRHASGEKIMFIDADDYINEDFIEKMVVSDSDFTVGSYTSNEGKCKIKKTYLREKDMLIKYALSRQNYRVLLVPYAKIYHLDILRKNNIFFDEKMNFGEDTKFVLNYMKCITSMEYVEIYGYNVRLVEGSLSRRYVDNVIEQMMSLYDAVLEVDDKYNNYFWCFRCIKTILYIERYSNVKKFKKTICNIREFKDFRNIRIKQLSLIDTILYLFLRLRLNILVYMLYKAKK